MFKGQMAEDTVKWAILRVISVGTDILITKSLSSRVSKPIKKTLLAGTL